VLVDGDDPVAGGEGVEPDDLPVADAGLRSVSLAAAQPVTTGSTAVNRNRRPAVARCWRELAVGTALTLVRLSCR